MSLLRLQNLDSHNSLFGCKSPIGLQEVKTTSTPEAEMATAQKDTVTVIIDGHEYESPRQTTPLALKLLVVPQQQAASYDLQEIAKDGHVIKTYRASTDDNKEVVVHEDERFQLIPNGAPFS